MKFLIYILLVPLIVSCSSNILDGDNIKLYSQLDQLPATGDPGLDDPTDPELNNPGLNMKNFIGGEFIKGSTKPQMIKWYLQPIDEKDQGLYSTRIEYSKDNGANWVLISESVPSIGETLMEYPWIVGAGSDWNGASYKIRITTTNVYGKQFVKETDGFFTVDNTSPTIEAQSFKVNEVQSVNTPGQGFSKIEVNRTYMSLAFSAHDNLSPVDAFCIKFNSSVAPSTSDDCWKNFNLISITPNKDLEIASVPAFIGFVASPYDVRLWVKDQAGNISNLRTGAGEMNTDKTMINFLPVTVPNISRILATNTVTPSTPPTRSEMTSAGGSLVIKWYTLPGGKGTFAAQNGINLEYTTDEETFFPIANGVLNTDNSNCFTAGDQSATSDDLYTGCYIWSSSLPTGYFRVRIVVTNDVGLVSQASSSPLNSGNFLSVAGNTVNSLGSSAETTIFNYRTDYSLVLPGTVVVTSWGKVFIRDSKFGIVSIDPTDGLAKQYIKKGTTAISWSGEGVHFSKATATPMSIALDYKDRLLILESDRIRRVEADGTINTLVGIKPGPDGQLASGYGPFADDGLISSTVDQPKADWYAKESGVSKYLTAEGCFKTNATPGIRGQYYKFKLPSEVNTFLIPLPNGDIYFASSKSWDMPIQSESGQAPYYAVYKEKDRKGSAVDRVYPLRLCGTGAYGANQDPYLDYASNNLKVRSTAGLLFNPSNSYIESLSLRGTQPVDANSENPYGLTFNPRSGKSRGSNTIYPNPGGRWDYLSYLTSRKGELFALKNIGVGVVKYNTGDNTWKPVFKGGNGQCYDDTKATDCSVDVRDFFQTIDNVPYFFDRGRVRAVSNQKVLTLFGQSRDAGDTIYTSESSKILGSPSTARLDLVEYLGVWGGSANPHIVLYDTNQHIMREIVPGVEIYKIMGNNGQGTCKRDPGTGKCSWETGFYSWGTPHSKLSNTFDSSTKTGSLDMNVSQYLPDYWGWSTGFVVDPDNGDIYSYSAGGPRHGIARFFQTTDPISGKTIRNGQMISGNYTGAGKYFLSKNVSNSCDNMSSMNCDISTVPRTNWAWTYAVTIPGLGVDSVTGKKTLFATTHDWSYTGVKPDGNTYGSHRQCFLKALRIPKVVNNSPIAATDLLSAPTASNLDGSIVQHVMGDDGECAGYGGVPDLFNQATPLNAVLTSNNAFPSWHSSSLPYQFMTEEDSFFMSQRGINYINKISFVRSSVSGVGGNVITGATLSAMYNIGEPIYSFNYKVEGTGITFIYCNKAGKLFKMQGTVKTELKFPDNSGILCSTRGKSIVWGDSGKSNFYFVYTQNNMNAIGQYYLE